MLKVDKINSFYGKAHVLRDLSFSVPKGNVVALLGRNGAGKTTTMKSIMQLVRPASGTVMFDGHYIAGSQPHKVAKLGLGYVPEERRIFTDLTVAENLIVGKQPPREGAVTWTEEMLFDLFPNLAERRNNRGKALSGGEQQMLSIARALARQIKVLLLDEPYEGLAPVIVDEIEKTLRLIKQEGMTTIIVEQNAVRALKLADRAVILDTGQIVFDGSAQDVLDDEALRAEYLAI